MLNIYMIYIKDFVNNILKKSVFFVAQTKLGSSIAI